jgi:NAD-dependent dihydropyrimidine dehydrogenase PreA subunit
MFQVTVDHDKCDGDGACVDICPSDVFVIKDGKSYPENMDDCVGCESCVEECAQGAITVEET